VINAVARVATEIDVGSAEVALAGVRAVHLDAHRPRTVEQLRANLASLENTLAPEQPPSMRNQVISGRVVDGNDDHAVTSLLSDSGTGYVLPRRADEQAETGILPHDSDD
jgi:hypothetical protein